MRRLTRDTLAVAGREFVIESPAAALDRFRRLYPHGWKGGAVGPVDLALTATGDQWHIRQGERSTGPLTGALQAAIALEYEIETSLVTGCRERIALHAGGIVAAGRAHLIAGAADTGKTTATLQLVELGHGFLCEEVALVDPDTLAVEPHPRTLGLDASHLDEIARDRPLERGEVHRLGSGLARYSPHDVRFEPSRLETVYLPRLRPRQGPHVAELDAADALPEILGYCFAPNVAQGLFFERLIHVLDACRIVRVQFDGIATARELWQRLLTPDGPA